MLLIAAFVAMTVRLGQVIVSAISILHTPIRALALATVNKSILDILTFAVAVGVLELSQLPALTAAIISKMMTRIVVLVEMTAPFLTKNVSLEAVNV